MRLLPRRYVTPYRYQMIGSVCRIEETGQIGIIVDTYVDEYGLTKPLKVKLTTGDIITVINQTITILTLIQKAIEIVKPIVHDIRDFFRGIFRKR